MGKQEWNLLRSGSLQVMDLSEKANMKLLE